MVPFDPLPSPNDDKTMNLQVMEPLKKAVYLLRIHPSVLQLELDKNKKFFLGVANKDCTLRYFKTIQINLVKIIFLLKILQRQIDKANENIKLQNYRLGRNETHYKCKISQIKVIIFILEADVFVREKILRNPRASNSYDWSHEGTGYNWRNCAH